MYLKGSILGDQYFKYNHNSQVISETFKMQKWKDCEFLREVSLSCMVWFKKKIIKIISSFLAPIKKFCQFPNHMLISWSEKGIWSWWGTYMKSIISILFFQVNVLEYYNWWFSGTMISTVASQQGISGLVLARWLEPFCVYVACSAWVCVSFLWALCIMKASVMQS